MFEQQLRKGLLQHLPNLNPNVVSASGATDLIDHVTKAVGGNKGIIQAVLSVYNRAVTDTFYTPAALGCLTLIAAMGVEWKSVKKNKQKKNKAAEGSEDIELACGKLTETDPNRSLATSISGETKESDLEKPMGHVRHASLKEIDPVGSFEEEWNNDIRMLAASFEMDRDSTYGVPAHEFTKDFV